MCEKRNHKTYICTFFPLLINQENSNLANLKSYFSQDYMPQKLNLSKKSSKPNAKRISQGAFQNEGTEEPGKLLFF